MVFAMRRRRTSSLVSLALSPSSGVVALAALCAPFAACRRAVHARPSSYMAPPLPAGFLQQEGEGWRIQVPSTWKNEPRAPAPWTSVDPQVVDAFHSEASVVTEAFAGESYDYAKANEVGLRKNAHATVEAVREEVVDGDPTLVIESRWSPAPPSAVVYQTMQVALASRGTGYVATCAAASNSFERYRSTCESILRSFAVER